MSDQPYRAQCAVTLMGPLDSAMLRATLEDLAERYEILRTTFPIIAGMSLPLQVIADSGTIAWTEIDLASADPKEQQQQTAALFAELLRLPLDLAQGPTLHAMLIRYAPESHALLLMLPALSADAAALQQLVARLIENYAASVQGAAPTDEPFQYADIAQWQNELLESPETAAGGNHWRKQSRFVAAPLLPPFAEIQPDAHDFQPATHTITLDAAMVEQIAGLDAHPGLSSALLLLTCWQVLLWRLSDQPDLALGVVDNGRKYDELADAIGLIAKHLPLATTVQPQTRLRDLAAQNAEALQANAQWQEYFTWDGFPPEQAYLPYSFEFAEQASPARAGALTVAIERLYANVDRFKLKLSCLRQAQTLSLELIYDSAAFAADTIRQLSDCLLTAISSALADLDAPVGALAIVSEAEREQLLGAWSVTPLPAPETLCIHEQWRRQAQATPNRIAVVELDQALSFAELNARADRLAQHLRGLDVGPEVVVGLYLEPSLDALIGILAILKAGGAYLPIDPGYPAERIAFMLADAQAAVVLTQASLQANLSASDLSIICLDDGWQPANPGADLPPAAVTVDNLAYVIYTSGSTGQPKGVAVTHRAAANFQHGMQTAVYDRWITQPVQTTLNAPLSFDASIQSLMLLVNGHTLHLLPTWLRQDNQALLSYLHERRIELITGTPTQIQLLVNAGLLIAAEHLPTLALVAGEAVAPELWAELAHAERTIFQNNYGPTECTVNTTSCTITPDAPEPVIGRPLANYEVYILDQRMQLVPVGMSGELYVGGPSIARGYLNRPALTAEKFVPNPFGVDSGARLYRTGDLAHFLPDGSLAFDGRIDQQVKINGFRVELGEIEATLRQQEAIQDAVVIARNDEHGYAQLVAYLVTGTEQPSSDEIRARLATQLPTYMVPALFVPLDRIPLTSSGKVDRRALPSPESAQLESGRAYVAPRTWQEEILVGIVSEVLGVERIGIDDNYFALGGDSIRSIEVRAMAEERGLSFTLQNLFQHQTIRRLAQFLETNERSSAAPATEPFSLISPADRSRLPADIVDAYPLSQLQTGMIFHSELSPGTATYQDVLTIHLRAPLNQTALQAATQQIMDAHPILRTSFDLQRYSEPLQLVHREIVPPLTMVDLRHLDAPQQEPILSAFVAEQQRRPFAWEHAPLFRLFVHQRTEQTFQWTLVMHHAILDGWSVATMLTDLFQRYLTLVSGATPTDALSPAATFREFVALEQAALANPAAQDHWRHVLAEPGSGQTLRGTAAASDEQVVHRVQIAPEIAEQLKQIARALTVPIKSVLLAAHLRVLSTVSGQRQVLTGLVANGRPETTDGERVLGLFLNTLPLQGQLDGGTWLDLIRSTFQAELESLPFRNYPLAQIQRDHGGQNLFDTIFNFTHFHVYEVLSESLQDHTDVAVLAMQHLDQTNFPLMTHFSVDPATDAIQLILNCNNLPAAHVETIADYFVATLRAIAETPHQRYETFSPLSEPESRQLLVEWNATEAAVPYDRSFAELFAAQVARTPDAIAAVYGTEQLSYAELNRRANRLAHTLVGQGVGPNTIVALLTNRSIDLLSMILAVFKAGGAYLPIDPRDPPQRVQQMLEQSAAALVLTDPSTAAQLKSALANSPTRPAVWTLDALTAESAADDDLPRRATPDDLAYVIYTSGSTGVPKGAMVEQRGMVNHLYAKIAELELTAADVVVQNASQSFDISVWQFLAALLVGGRVVIVPDAIAHDPAQLLRVIADADVTVVEMVPALLQMMLPIATETRATLPRLRWMIATGEALAPELCRTWLDLYPQIPLLNAYGPTECSDDVTHHRISAAPPLEARAVPIGRPIINMRIYLLDQHLQPVPVGVPGEIYVGGVGVGRGYLHDPRRTAEVFMPDPFAHEDSPGARLYRTGDLGRYQADGTIAFGGRIDHQVKLHGFRIELGEIEAALREHEAIREAVVVLRDDRLVAYIVGEQKNKEQRNKEQNENLEPRTQNLGDETALSFSPSPAATDTEAGGGSGKGDTGGEGLRTFLAQRLPEYMLPAAFVTLNALPLTPNGKVDRRALPAPAAQLLDRPLVAPQTPTEQIIAEIWQALLNVSPISIHDHFFTLGGHSLLATQLIFRLREAFQIDLPLRMIYDAPSIAQQALVIEAAILEDLARLSDEEAQMLLDS